MDKEKSNFLLIIPVALFGIMILCFLIASLLEFPTNRGTVYSSILMLALAIFFLALIPCIIVSIIGIISEKKNKTSTNKNHNALYVLGIIDLVLSIIIALLAVLLFIGGLSI